MLLLVTQAELTMVKTQASSKELEYKYEVDRLRKAKREIEVSLACSLRLARSLVLTRLLGCRFAWRG